MDRKLFEEVEKNLKGSPCNRHHHLYHHISPSIFRFLSKMSKNCSNSI